jgi:hypothetical protein
MILIIFLKKIGSIARFIGTAKALALFLLEVVLTFLVANLWGSLFQHCDQFAWKDPEAMGPTSQIPRPLLGLNVAISIQSCILPAAPQGIMRFPF